LAVSVIEGCFREGSVTHVDKQQCGNGFSTGFLKITPQQEKVNIIIAPNRAVVMEKELAYRNGVYSDKRIKFFYKNSTDTDIHNADILFFVADSFLQRSKSIQQILPSIDKVLIDEYHTTESQSLYRSRLINFIEKVKEICNDPGTAITTVTATPNHLSRVDIKLNNGITQSIDINVRHDREKGIERVKKDIKAGANVIVFTNSASTIYRLRNRKHELQAKFVVGDSLLRSLSERVIIKPDESSNLTIVSSKGFEGFDLYYKNARIYFFEDRRRTEEQFFLSNLYQAINRNRPGSNYIEYNRIETDGCNEFNPDRIHNFINTNVISVFNKQQYKYKKFHPFVIFDQDEKGKFSIKANEVAIQLELEKQLYDKRDFEQHFKDFLSDRGVNLHFTKENNRSTVTKLKKDVKMKRLKDNVVFIKGHDLFGNDYRLSSGPASPGLTDKQIVSHFQNRISTYFRRKNYDGLYGFAPYEVKADIILNNNRELKKLINQVLKIQFNRYDEKYSFREAMDKKKLFKQTVTGKVCQLITMFANHRIDTNDKWIGNRNYNLTTEVGIASLKLVGEYMGRSVTEVDVNSCYPRIVYSLVGKTLPGNFYGVKKVLKKPINVFLNSFRYTRGGKSKQEQQEKAINQFNQLGFDADVIKYLMGNYFETEFKGDLFNSIAWHEKKLISKIMNVVYQGSNSGVVRRHDSVLIFDNENNLTRLNQFVFNNVGGWFCIGGTGSVKLNIGVDMEEYFRKTG